MESTITFPLCLFFHAKYLLQKEILICESQVPGNHTGAGIVETLAGWDGVPHLLYLFRLPRDLIHEQACGPSFIDLI